jgi:hypothetical protein
MGDYQKVEINEPTTNEVEPEEKPQEEAVEQQPEVQEEQQADRPEWLPEKFESAEDMAKAYSELEKKMGAGEEEKEQEETTEENESEETQQDLTELQSRVNDASTKYFESGGEITDETYQALEEVGISRELVDRFKAGQESLENAEISDIQSAAGDEYEAMAQWAGDSLDDDEFNAFNEVVNNGTVQQAKLAVKGLYARYKSEVGATGPKLVSGSTTGSSTMPYQSMQEVSRAMQDPRYKSGDKAYHNEVDRRLAVSNF